MTDTTNNQNIQGKTLEGVVVKNAMKDTVTVSVERYVNHQQYQKFQRLSQKYLVHNPGNTANVGDRVTIRETRPISKRKCFVIQSHIAKAESVE